MIVLIAKITQTYQLGDCNIMLKFNTSANIRGKDAYVFLPASVNISMETIVWETPKDIFFPFPSVGRRFADDSFKHFHCLQLIEPISTQGIHFLKIAIIFFIIIILYISSSLKSWMLCALMTKWQPHYEERAGGGHRGKHKQSEWWGRRLEEFLEFRSEKYFRKIWKLKPDWKDKK